MNSELVFNTMEVLETKPVSELVTEATIKVCYVSETPNRNGTVITKEVGREIAATLPGAPVVGLFDENAQDFVEHSRKVTIKDGEVQISDLTKPYGFVSFDKPWYQDFIEDGVNRTYLMCKAYLWTKQYKEAAAALNKGQSMELDGDSMCGYYEGDVFVFTHATLDRLCILGDKYEPCFEGARIMTTYARQFNTLAEEVEDIIGRRYFVHQGQLVPHMEKNTLKYALELGYDLHEAIMAQLLDRGMTQYRIEGIFAEAGTGIFAILQNTETLEFCRVIILIGADDTVQLGPEVQAVSLIWKDKPPKDETVATPIQDNPTVVAASGNGANTTLQFTEAESKITELETQIAEYTAKITELENQITDFTAKEAEYTNKIGELENQVNEYANKEQAIVDVTEYTNKIAELEAKITEFSNTDESAAKIVSLESQVAEYTAKIAEFEENANKIADLEAQIAEYTAKVGELETQLSSYQAAEAKAEELAKEEMVNSYKALLSEEEMKDVVEKVNEYSLDEVESKLSIVYTRKMRAASQENKQNIQLNVGNIKQDTNDDAIVPSFMLKAMEYEQTHQL